jgi:GT2 family glycosyltransferase
MATRIVQIDLAGEVVPVGGLDGYQYIWIFVRHGRRPLGWVRSPRQAVGQQLLPQTIRMLVADQLGAQVFDSLLAGPPAPPKYAPPISVIVCTRDHPQQLHRQLQSLMKLVYPRFEVVVVDNAPKDEQTRLVCQRYPSVRNILEPQPGLDYARNTGWRCAAHDLVAYTDDDATVDPHWLTAIGEEFQNPDVQCVTGLTLPLELETEAQEWFENYGGFCRGFVRRVHSRGPWTTFFPLGAGHFGSGVNMALRKSLLQQTGGFDNALDTGSLTRGGGDLDIFVRAIKAGTLVYQPAALAWHEHRRTMPQLQRQMFDYGYGYFAFLTKYEQSDPELATHATAMKRAWPRYWGWKRLMRNLKLALRWRPHFPINLIVREMLGFARGSPSYARSVAAVQQAAAQQGQQT